MKRRCRDDYSRGPEFKKLKPEIRERDGHCCRLCGAHVESHTLHVHHIDWNRKNNHPDNLVTLCEQCHISVHRDGYRPDLYGKGHVPKWGFHPGSDRLASHMTALENTWCQDDDRGWCEDAA